MLGFNCLIPRLLLKLQEIPYGPKLRLVGWPVIFRFPRARLSLGEGVTINSNFWSNMLGLYHRTIIVAKNGASVRIGNHVGLSGVAIYARREIEIGDDCVIGANVKIVDNDFHPLDPEARRRDDPACVASAPVKIGRNVFIGMNTIILKGVELGDNCVVGAGSVVHGRFEAGCVIAGNPAKVIRRIDP